MGEAITGTQTHFYRSGDKTSALLDLRKVNWDHFCPSVHHSAAESLTNTDFSENEERCGVESFWLKVSGVMTKRFNRKGRSNHASNLFFLLVLNKVHVWCMYIKKMYLSLYFASCSFGLDTSSIRLNQHTFRVLSSKCKNMFLNGWKVVVVKHCEWPQVRVLWKRSLFIFYIH